MKYKLLFLPIIITFSCFCSNIKGVEKSIEAIQSQNIMSHSTFQLNLKLIRREKSKDSNNSTTSLNITNGIITISEKHGGFKAQEDTYQEKELTPEMLIKICQLIEREKLHVNITEHKETLGIGNEGHLSLKLTGTYNTEINISGQTNIWGSDQYILQKWGKQYVDSRTNIQNIEYFGKANYLISFIKEL